MAGFAFGIELTFDHHLRGDTGMIGARLPESVIAFHTVITGQQIHNGVIKAMSHMQTAGDIGWWQHNGVRRALTRRFEFTILFPLLIPALFYCIGGIGFVHASLRYSVRKKKSGHYTRLMCARS